MSSHENSHQDHQNKLKFTLNKDKASQAQNEPKISNKKTNHAGSAPNHGRGVGTTAQLRTPNVNEFHGLFRDG